MAGEIRLFRDVILAVNPDVGSTHQAQQVGIHLPGIGKHDHVRDLRFSALQACALHALIKGAIAEG
jgi:hypothetical protein